jgi:hypothetical protein
MTFQTYIFQGILSLFSSLCNIVILTVIIKGRFHNRHLYGNIIFITCSDLGYGLSVLTRNVVFAFISIAYNLRLCKVFMIMIQYMLMNSLNGMLLLSIEYYFKIKNIAQIHEKLSTKNLGMLCFVLLQ